MMAEKTKTTVENLAPNERLAPSSFPIPGGDLQTEEPYASDEGEEDEEVRGSEGSDNTDNAEAEERVDDALRAKSFIAVRHLLYILKTKAVGQEAWKSKRKLVRRRRVQNQTRSKDFYWAENEVSNGLHLIRLDSDVVRMYEFGIQNGRICHVYWDHIVDVPEEVEVVDVVDDEPCPTTDTVEQSTPQETPRRRSKKAVHKSLPQKSCMLRRPIRKTKSTKVAMKLKTQHLPILLLQPNQRHIPKSQMSTETRPSSKVKQKSHLLIIHSKKVRM
ncbi:hypothetical protein HN873_070242, partial [Arachis hypogaea]